VLEELEPASEVFSDDEVAPGLLGAIGLFELGSLMPPVVPKAPEVDCGPDWALGIAFVLPGVEETGASFMLVEVPVEAGAFVDAFEGA